jgi:dephospho-CoA kinase
VSSSAAPRTESLHRVGLTGGIGSGKSLVARLLADHGAVVLDADEIARDAVAPGTAGLAAVVCRFGTAVLAPDGSLDRAALGRRVFADPADRAALEAITHPLIRAETERRAVLVPAGSLLVHEVPLLVELGLGAAYDAVVVVEAPLEARLERLERDRGLGRPEALARVAAQASDEQRRAVASHVVTNDGDPAALAANVNLLWAQLVGGAGGTGGNVSDPAPIVPS